jgi:hypothetical protein
VERGKQHEAMGYCRDGRVIDAGGCLYRRGRTRIFGETLSYYLERNFRKVLKMVVFGAILGALMLLLNWSGCIEGIGVYL